MNHGLKYAKPRRAGRGFARSVVWAMFADASYRIGTPSANACLSFLPVAFHGAGRGAALLWGTVL